MTASGNALDRFAERVRELYSLPAVAVKVLELTGQPQVDLRALKACIENDPALSAKILRVVNSSLFGMSRSVGDLNQALALLGIKPLKLLVLGFSLSDALAGQARGKATDRYWRRTLTQAVAAREISERIWNLPGDEAFLAALLQDVGMLVLLQELGEPYARVLERTVGTDRDIAALERSVFGFDHYDVSARLLDQWSLPPYLLSAIRLSLRPDELQLLPRAEQALPRILALSRLLADVVVDRRHATLEQLLAEPAPLKPLTLEQIEALIEQLSTKVAQLAEVFACELPAGVDYRDVLVEAHKRLSRLATELAADVLSGPPADTEEELVLLAEVQGLGAAMEQFSARATRQAVPPPPSTAKLPAAAAPPAPAPRTATAVAAKVAPGLREHLATAVAACRQKRVPLSLVIVEIDRFDMLARSQPFVAEHAAHLLEQLAATCDASSATRVAVRQGCYALVLPDCDRSEAVDHADRLLQSVRNAVERERSQGTPGCSVSLGVATAPAPAKNFRADNLIESANRCLSAAQLSGGNTLKSIGTY